MFLGTKCFQLLQSGRPCGRPYEPAQLHFFSFPSPRWTTGPQDYGVQDYNVHIQVENASQFGNYVLCTE
jgi:hypothetical protein